MRPPCPYGCADDDRSAVFGFGDVNADFHVIGDHPGVHGGTTTGVPFTDGESLDRFLAVLESVGLLERTPSEMYPIASSNCFLSYLYMCCLPPGTEPTVEEYARLERFFDAELRAINAHILLPVGDRPLEHVLREYTTQSHKLDADSQVLHASEVRGRGALVVPIADPSDWTDNEPRALKDRLTSILGRDYRQMADLGRFEPTSEPYFVR